MGNSNWKWAVGGALVIGLLGASCRDNKSDVVNGNVKTHATDQTRDQSWNPGGDQGTGSFDSTRGVKTLGNDQGTQTQGWGNSEGTGGSGSNPNWHPEGQQEPGAFDSTANTPTLPGPVRDDGSHPDDQQGVQPDRHNQTR